MPLYTFKDKQIAEVTSTNFATEKIREREDIQAALRDKIDVISPDTLIISEEFSEWSEGGRRIDLLGIDKQANIVVIELKRDETGAHMELQSLRYAAMVSTLTFKKAVEIYQKYLDRRGIIKDAEIELVDFLGWSDPLEDLFPTDVRIVLASAINQYLAEHEDTTLQRLKEVFPDSWQGTLGVTTNIEKAQEIFSKTSHKRHFLAENDILRTADGSEIAVCTEWGKGKAGSPGNIDNFIDCAKKLGYQIEAE